MIRFLSYLILGVCFVQTPDSRSAYVSFEISHLGVLTVEGRLDGIKGSIEKVSESEWRVEGEIHVRSINTGDESRDKTILTEQYLNASKYPSIPFIARIKKEKDGYMLQVESNVRGLLVSFDSRLKTVNDLMVSEPVVIDRAAIGLDFGAMDSLIGDEITIVIHSGIPAKEFEEQ